ncbi:endolytic transglycosylase MltG [Thiopseudomonas alkaliphila]|uniref:endolytic transglycosylase MltG n=1 Tax=Thiopseudomonas alkaliphila TaxID=1697053 RepID=UPI0025777E9B|nr:endolytic transglycosylase MltG [Thiopseudomonas alkaliphila]MDM1707221.1 endolytic transglycosylase MltG [Thiopseudomonas alkaliphila]
MFKKILIAMLLLISAVVLSAGLAWQWYQRTLQQPLKLEQAQVLVAESGSTPSGLLSRLAADGIIQDSFWLRLHWRYYHPQQALYVGEYEITPTMTAADLLQKWVKGEVVQYRLTLVEGWNIQQVRQALASHPALKQTLSAVSNEQLMQQLGLPAQHPEGRFFPDTYQFVRGQTDQALLKQANQKLEQVLQQEWQQRAENLPYQSKQQALVMASIIEKETGVAHERAEIAGVFVRRLAKGMRLQTDPTVIYGMGERYQGKITRADLRQPTPYNTYVIEGLPPTPIAMVGREAIHAALQPKAGDSLYFVAKGDGSHVFSRSLAEHNQAVRQYQLQRRADYRSSPAPSVTPSESAQGAQP